MLAGAAAGLAAQETPRAPGRPGPEPALRIDFETLPGGGPACERCPVPAAFRELGLVFSFASRFGAVTDAWLVGSGAYDPEGEERNHAVTATLGDRGFRPGVLVLDLPRSPLRVAFRLRGSDVVPHFAVRASGSDTRPLPGTAISRTRTRTYRAGGGGRFREERIVVEAPYGVDRIELDGTGPPGHILLVDDVTLWPALEPKGGSSVAPGGDSFEPRRR